MFSSPFYIPKIPLRHLPRSNHLQKDLSHGHEHILLRPARASLGGISSHIRTPTHARLGIFPLTHRQYLCSLNSFSRFRAFSVPIFFLSAFALL